MKQPPVSITLGNKTYSVCISHLSLDRFYALMRAAALNKALHHSPLLDDSQIAALWTIFSDSCNCAHRMIIEHVLEHLTTVSGDLDHAPISPSTMTSEMISSLPDDDEQPVIAAPII